jgi:hypothetical protein
LLGFLHEADNVAIPNVQRHVISQPAVPDLIALGPSTKRISATSRSGILNRAAPLRLD